jgi:toxin-antitoxin system PIN domain toxin
MILWDVNLWVYAFRQDSPMHSLAYSLLFDSLAARTAFAFSPTIAASFIRIATNPKIFVQPSSLQDAWTFIDYLDAHPASVFVDVDAMAFGIFKHLCLVSDVRGNGIPDALLAAMTIRYDAELWSADRGFSRFQGLRFRLVETP